MKVKIVEVDIYNTFILFLQDKKLSNTFDYICLEYNMDRYDLIENENDQAVTMEYDGKFFISLSNNDMATLVHEIVHVTWSILERAQIKLKNDYDEVQAYLAGFIMRKFQDTKWDII